MTLVLTELSKFGIAMAADSAMTYGTDVKRTLNGVQKLQIIPKLNTGIACWGEGEINGIETDIWLDKFIKDRKKEYNSIDEFALLLQKQLREYIDEIDATKLNFMFGTIGFHLAGFVEYQNEQVPTFYHIHNGRSLALEHRYIKINPNIVNANHDLPPNIVKEHLRKGTNPVTRNGEIEIYALIFDQLDDFFKLINKNTPIKIPYSLTLEDRVDWLKFQIKTISGLYELSNIGPTIGGEISTLTISSNGIQSFKCINPYFKL